MKKMFLMFLIIVSTAIFAEQTEEIAITINFTCPPSEQLEAFKNSRPDAQRQTVNYEEFQSSFTENMTKLIQLVKSGKIYKSDWSVHVKSDKSE